MGYLEGIVKFGDICLMMRRVVHKHGLIVDVGLQRIILIGELRQGV